MYLYRFTSKIKSSLYLPHYRGTPLSRFVYFLFFYYFSVSRGGRDSEKRERATVHRAVGESLSSKKILLKKHENTKNDTKNKERRASGNACVEGKRSVSAMLSSRVETRRWHSARKMRTLPETLLFEILLSARLVPEPTLPGVA